MILNKLRGGDLRSIGRANEVAMEIQEDPDLFREVFNGMMESDPVVRMRCADAVEKASALNPSLFQPCKAQLLEEISRILQQEVRWHVAQMMSRLNMTESETSLAVQIL
ncbi:MAG: hypothetical protein NWE89_17640 [Candidatus Bathyarchaeota archaeon]|nr:hypothetical protein [Candidatus Bathyarchaeota archaeon]